MRYVIIGRNGLFERDYGYLPVALALKPAVIPYSPLIIHPSSCCWPARSHNNRSLFFFLFWRLCNVPGARLCQYPSALPIDRTLQVIKMGWPSTDVACRALVKPLPD